MMQIVGAAPRYRGVPSQAFFQPPDFPNEPEGTNFSLRQEIQRTASTSFFRTFRKTVPDSAFHPFHSFQAQYRKIPLGSCLSAENKPRSFSTSLVLDFISLSTTWIAREVSGTLGNRRGNPRSHLMSLDSNCFPP